MTKPGTNVTARREIIVTRGLPYSGKTTWAQNVIKHNPGQWIHIDKKEIKEEYSHLGKIWIDIFFTQIADALLLNYNVIVEDFNIFGMLPKAIGKGMFERGVRTQITEKFFSVNYDDMFKRNVENGFKYKNKQMDALWNAAKGHNLLTFPTSCVSFFPSFIIKRAVQWKVSTLNIYAASMGLNWYLHTQSQNPHWWDASRYRKFRTPNEQVMDRYFKKLKEQQESIVGENVVSP
jgi:hypothetical protein